LIEQPDGIGLLGHRSIVVGEQCSFGPECDAELSKGGR
jgi:hypothetical protein